MLGALRIIAPRDVEGLGHEAGGAGWCWPAAGGGEVLGALGHIAPRDVEGLGLDVGGEALGREDDDLGDTEHVGVLEPGHLGQHLCGLAPDAHVDPPVVDLHDPLGLVLLVGDLVRQDLALAAGLLLALDLLTE